MPSTDQVSLRRLSGTAAELNALQRVVDGAPGYSLLLTGAPPESGMAQAILDALPEHKRFDDKFVLGIFEGELMVGCMDLIRAFPDAGTAHLGLLLIAEQHARQGVGRAACVLLERLVRSWPEVVRIRLGVVSLNAPALAFWPQQGFVPTGEVKPYRHGTVTAQTILFAKAMAAGPGAGGFAAS